eukprot:TRINITY_DN6408_c0_g1_i1.p1 TRINITY_DN6408_c0_g1~~TRINITY_DN6408_c0_g1_i1.p1  ORF type:complete len:861 (+),score=258.68 TRINITY_DN6408_c0_g1_i1:34-2616(+)
MSKRSSGFDDELDGLSRSKAKLTPKRSTSSKSPRRVSRSPSKSTKPGIKIPEVKSTPKKVVKKNDSYEESSSEEIVEKRQSSSRAVVKKVPAAPKEDVSMGEADSSSDSAIQVKKTVKESNAKMDVDKSDKSAGSTKKNGTSTKKTTDSTKKSSGSTKKASASSKSNAKSTPSKRVTRSTRKVKKESSSSDDDSSFSSLTLSEEIKKKPAKVVKKTVKKETSSSSSSSSFSSIQEKKKRRRRTTTTSKKTKKEPVKREPKKRARASAPDAKKQKKKAEPKVKKEENVVEWWNEDTDDWKKGKMKNWKWRTLRHAGVYFPPPYEPHGVKMLYDGKEIELTPEAEELASFFARYVDKPDYLAKPNFITNFFSEFRKVLGKKHKIKKYELCDFTPINIYLTNQAEIRRNRSKEVKQAEKAEKEALREIYGWAEMDGRKEKVANWTVEIPGLFLGRGKHPKAGLVKKRIMPEDVTLNLDEEAEVPPCPIKGHKWGAVVHNHTVQWIAAWKDPITGRNKYVQFDSSGSIRGKSDRDKFETARELRKHIKKIRKDYTSDFKAKKISHRQRATALYLIDKLAIRAGNPKGKDEADTVGCCSLRKEHMKLIPPSTIELDFLGKDSMRYQNSVKVEPAVYANLKRFLKGKRKGDLIFDALTVSSLNAHLKSLMPGLSAKVFRTYNASVCMEKELQKFDFENAADTSAPEKLLFFQKASVEVAILCNHQRTVSKTFDEQVQKLQDKIKNDEELIEYIKHVIKRARVNKEPSRDPPDPENPPKLPKTVDGMKKKIQQLSDRILATQAKIEEKDATKSVSTTTSKINYIDPRITAAWANKVGMPITRVFSATVRRKFGWAIDEVESKPDFKF